MQKNSFVSILTRVWAHYRKMKVTFQVICLLVLGIFHLNGISSHPLHWKGLFGLFLFGSRNMKRLKASVYWKRIKNEVCFSAGNLKLT